MIETKKCDFCKSVIDIDASVCPVCLREQLSYRLENASLIQNKSNTSKNKNKIIIYSSLGLLLVFTILAVILYREIDYRNRLEYAQKTYETELHNYTACVNSNSNLTNLQLYFRCGYKPVKPNIFK